MGWILERKFHKIKFFLYTNIIFFIIGCSSTYKVTNYYTKKELDEDFNNSAKSKELNITLKTDSTIKSMVGGKIQDDSLLVEVKKIKIENGVIPLNEISSIEYKSSNFHSAHLLLINGKEIDADNIVVQPQSLKCRISENLIIHKKVPIDLVKEIKYKNHLKGIPLGFISGVAIGGIIGGLFINSEEGGNNPRKDSTSGILLGSFSGAIIGSIVGYIIGWNNIYQFNP